MAVSILFKPLKAYSQESCSKTVNMHVLGFDDILVLIVYI